MALRIVRHRIVLRPLAISRPFCSTRSRFSDDATEPLDAKPHVENLFDLKDGLGIVEAEQLEQKDVVDWSRSFHGLSSEPFSKEVADLLMQELHPDDVEIKPGKNWTGLSFILPSFQAFAISRRRRYR